MNHLSDEKIIELKKIANIVRQDVIEMLTEAGSGHTAGSLDMADVFSYLYFEALKHDPKNPNWPDRDRLILSNGHICPVLYATMAEAGYFSKTELKTLRRFNSKLQGHPDRKYLSSIETSSGPIGSGLSQAVGMALVDQLDNGFETKKTIYCITGDGEQDEGQNWEAVMLASKYKLDNLIVIIDRNYIQISGKTEDVMPIDSLAEKYRAFNWHVEEIDGHDFKEIHKAVISTKKIKFRPSVIIAYTIPAKGVKEWESDYHWHGKVPTKKEAEIALKELNKLGSSF